MDGTRRSPGIPRTHSTVADEFFQTDPFRNFDYHGTAPPYGNQRFEDDPFFDHFNRQFHEEPPFQRTSFPRRTFHQHPAYEETGSEAERPMFTHQQTVPNYHQRHESPLLYRKDPIQTPHHHQRSKSHYDNVDDAHQPSPQKADPNIRVIKIHHEGQPHDTEQMPKNMGDNSGRFVEINNATPNYETLNSDKRSRFSNYRNDNNDRRQNMRAPSVPNITIDDYSKPETVEQQQCPPTVPIPLPAPAIPLPAPEGMQMQTLETDAAGIDDDNNPKEAERNNIEKANAEEEQTPVEEQIKEFVSVADSGDGLIRFLDETEQQVEQLREITFKMEKEKALLLERISNIQMTVEGMTSLPKGERDELLLNTARILSRCNAVNITIETPRDQHQTRALELVNQMIQFVMDHMRKDLAGSKLKIQSFLNACHPDDDVGHIDENFQYSIIECTADDQKKIRHKLAQILEEIEQMISRK